MVCKLRLWWQGGDNTRNYITLCKDKKTSRQTYREVWKTLEPTVRERKSRDARNALCSLGPGRDCSLVFDTFGQTFHNQTHDGHSQHVKNKQTNIQPKTDIEDMRRGQTGPFTLRFIVFVLFSQRSLGSGPALAQKGLHFLFKTKSATYACTRQAKLLPSYFCFHTCESVCAKGHAEKWLLGLILQNNALSDAWAAAVWHKKKSAKLKRV